MKVLILFEVAWTIPNLGILIVFVLCLEKLNILEALDMRMSSIV